jgi:diguanylate cyclase (GGDEF)-like protein
MSPDDLDLSPLANSLEGIVEEYKTSQVIDADTVIAWENRISDPHDLMELYDMILNDRLIPLDREKTIDQRTLGYVMVQRKKALEESRQLSTTDSLTGLLNQRGYDAELDVFSRRYQRHNRENENPAHFAVLFIDVNGFKEANDSYGHDIGDDILRYTAEALKEDRRGSDIVARYGGDEFTLILDEFEPENAEKFGNALAEKVNTYVKEKLSEEHDIETDDISVSIGMAIYGVHSKDVRQLLRNADIAMYHVKKRIKETDKVDNSFHVFDPEREYETRKPRD